MQSRVPLGPGKFHVVVLVITIVSNKTGTSAVCQWGNETKNYYLYQTVTPKKVVGRLDICQLMVLTIPDERVVNFWQTTDCCQVICKVHCLSFQETVKVMCVWDQPQYLSTP